MNLLLKLALPTLPPLSSVGGAARRAVTILPKATAAARAVPAFPKPPKLPGAISAAFKDAPSAAGQAPGVLAGKGFDAAAQMAPTVPPGKLIKAASAAFFAELEAMIAAGVAPPMLREKWAAAEVEELVKHALNLQGVGQALKGGLGAVGKGIGGAIGGARGAIANVAGKVSPTLNKPVMGLAQDVAHKLQHSPNSFAQGVGNVLHHKTQTPGKAFLAVANPVGTVAEALTAGVGTAASKGLAAAGGRLQKATAAVDAVAREGRAMTPKGRLMNAAESFGGRIQKTFSPGGAGHNIATKHLPLGAEIGGAVGAGLALHAPVGLAGVVGKMGLMGAGKLAPALGAAIDHAPGAIDAIAHKVGPALRGLGGAAQHTAEDLLGTKGQSVLGRLGKPAAATVRHSMMPPAMA